MSHRIPLERRCSYVVVLDQTRDDEEEVFELAQYLSTISRTEVDVVVADGSTGERLERNRSILRWVSRHVPLAFAAAAMNDETVRAAVGVAASEKVIIATADVRYTPAGLAQTCELLDLYAGVAPQDFYAPLPWWSGIEMSRLLLQRAFEAATRLGSTLAVRRSAVLVERSRRAADGTRISVVVPSVAPLEIHSSSSVVVRRRPPTFPEWLGSRASAAAEDFDYPARTVIFLGAAPLLVLVALTGGAKIAATYMLVVVLASIALALRGALSAKGAPLRASLFAPLWLAERSVSVYWAAFGRWRSGRVNSPDEREREAQRGSRVASGE